MTTSRLWIVTLASAALLCAAETPVPALIVLNKTDATLAIIDPATGKTVAQVPTGEGPHEVAVSTDGRMAFVGNYGGQTPGSTLSVIDLVAQKELHRVDVAPLRRPHGMAFADGKLYFTAEVNRIWGRYDPAANHVDWLMGTGQGTSHMILVNHDATRVFTANIGSDSIAMFERGANPLAWSETVIPVGKGPEAVDVSPDGKEVWTAHSRDGGVSVIDVASKKVVQTLNLGTKRSNRLKFTPDGKHVLISDLDAGQVLVLDAAARKEINRINTGGTPEGILVVPDGSHAYIALAGGDRLAIVDLKTFAVTGHVTTGRGPDGMAWAVRR